jgi:hypothetical protein
MSNDRRLTKMNDAGLTPYFAATPPPQAAPMPKQTLIFWTPRLALVATLRNLRDMRQRGAPQQIASRAIVRVTPLDESK